MSTNLAVFLFGIPLMAFWLAGLRNGVMLRFFSGVCPVLIRRSNSPVHYWIAAAFWGIYPAGFILLPLMAWAGWRH
jgi:hypothetical protein